MGGADRVIGAEPPKIPALAQVMAQAASFLDKAAQGALDHGGAGREHDRGHVGRASAAARACRALRWHAPDALYVFVAKTKRARSCRSISNGVMRFTPRPMQTFGILIFFVVGAATSCVTSVCSCATA
jgi:hypothetical protein